MKKLFAILVLSAAMCSVSTVCQAEKVDVNVQIDDPLGDFPVHRGPTLLPTVDIDGYTLSYEGLLGGHFLQILQGDTVVYSTALIPGSDSVDLPSTLSGAYEFRFVADTYYYYGYITL